MSQSAGRSSAAQFLGAGSASHQRPCQVVAEHVLELERTLNQRVGIRRLSRQGGAPPCLAKELLCLKALCHNLGLVEALLTTTRSAFFLVFFASLTCLMEWSWSEDKAR